MPKDLRLRPATLEDAECLYAWRNDPQTRAASHNEEEIPFQAHLDWLKAGLGNPHRKLYIAEENSEPVGTVRADWQEGVFLLSWTIAPGARGRGIGKRMVSMLVQILNAPVCAEIKVGNVASEKIALFAGMRLERIEDGIKYYSSKLK